MIDNERSEVDTGKDFHFRVYLQDTKINGLFGDISYKRGVKHGGKSAINLSLGTAYEVVKVESNQDGYITTSKGAKDYNECFYSGIP